MSNEAPERSPMTVGHLKATLAEISDDLEILIRMSVEIPTVLGPQDISLIGDMGTVSVAYDTDDKPFCAIDFNDGDFEEG